MLPKGWSGLLHGGHYYVCIRLNKVLLRVFLLWSQASEIYRACSEASQSFGSLKYAFKADGTRRALENTIATVSSSRSGVEHS